MARAAGRANSVTGTTSSCVSARRPQSCPAASKRWRSTAKTPAPEGSPYEKRMSRPQMRHLFASTPLMAWSFSRSPVSPTANSPCQAFSAGGLGWLSWGRSCMTPRYCAGGLRRYRGSGRRHCICLAFRRYACAMRATSAVLFEVLRTQVWVVPSIAALLAAASAVVLIWFDGATGSLGLPLAIGADSARAVLSAISGAMISFTALVFSITMLVLQSASTQLSPRVVRTFLRDRFNQGVLGLFVATFVFSLLVLTSVTVDQVPRLGVLAAVGLVLVAVLAFVAYIDHMAKSIRPTSVIESISAETRAVIEHVYPDSESRNAPEGPDRSDRRGTRRGPGGRVVRGLGLCPGLRSRGLAGVRSGTGRRGRAAGRHRQLPGPRPAVAVGAGPRSGREGGRGAGSRGARSGWAPERTMAEDPSSGSGSWWTWPCGRCHPA